MPVQECELNGKPGFKWGQEGHCYTYTTGNESSKAKAKSAAHAQGVAIIRSGGKYAAQKIGFDWDETLSTSKGKELAQSLSANTLYIVTARSSKDGISSDFIPDEKIFATGSNKAKVEKVKELGLDVFYDNNPDVIKELPGIGKLFK